MNRMENFLFIDAENCPGCGFDLDGIDYSRDENDDLLIVFRLGWVYDSYHLKFLAADPVRWEFWHEDSAVVAREPVLESVNPPFSCQPLSTLCDIALRITVDGQKIQGRATGMSIRSMADPFSFVIQFDVTGGKRLYLTPEGWKIEPESVS